MFCLKFYCTFRPPPNYEKVYCESYRDRSEPGLHRLMKEVTEAEEGPWEPGNGKGEAMCLGGEEGEGKEVAGES